ncbi:hypothetical protein EH220_06165 [bacterium]|nr:MAG: hypothetical protein EH220_06165 [bacterium]
MTNADRSRVYHDVDRLERKIDEAILRLERECERLAGNSSDHSTYQGSSRACGSKLWGWVLLMAGVVWLADSIGWLSFSLPWGPLAIILLGVALLYRRSS